MKIKKFNALLATAVLAGGLLVASAGSLVSRALVSPFRAATQAGVEVTEAVLPSAERADPFSLAHEQVTEIPFRHFYRTMPAEATLKKWVKGDRTYYELSGPFNPAFAEKSLGDGPGWGYYPVYEVFFPRGEGAYDQWIINPHGSVIYHFDQPFDLQAGSYEHLVGSSVLPTSRYRTKVEGDRITISFWCHNHDQPGNVVFNYNDPTGPALRPLATATTAVEDRGIKGYHHYASWWTYP